MRPCLLRDGITPAREPYELRVAAEGRWPRRWRGAHPPLTHPRAPWHHARHALTAEWLAGRPTGRRLAQFVLVAGSHKMLYPLPRPKHTAIDLGLVRHLEPKAGSVVTYFASTAHGVQGWTGKTERRAVMSKAFTRLYPSSSKL